MHSDHESTVRAQAAGTGSASDTHLTGRWMTAAHIVWAALIICTLVLYFVCLPVYFAQLEILCRAASCAPGQLSASAADALIKIGLSLKGYATVSLLLVITWSLVWFSVGGILAWRKFNDWMAMLIALMLITLGAESITNTVAASHSPWQLPAQLVDFLAFALLGVVFTLFPDGRFVPRWSYWFLIGFLVESVVFNFFSNVSFIAQSWLNTLGNIVFYTTIVSVTIAQVYRYRRVSTPAQRQQTKWVVYSFALIILLGFATWALEFFFPPLAQPGSLFFVAFGPDADIFFLLIPLSFGIAILRYRLYDIDIIINRTLVYGSLTIVLALVYAGLILGLQTLLSSVTGGSNLAIVASTLVIAALFQPLRRRLQDLIDRRFYRRKYDAAKILAAFSASSREEVDLTRLGERLVSVVEETMQPTQVWLWLRPLQSERKSQVIDHPPAF